VGRRIIRRCSPLIRLKASAMALLIAITLLIYAYKPSDHEEVSESPTTQTSAVKPFDDALQAPKPTIVAEDIPQDDAESTQVKPEPKPTAIAVEATFYTAKCDGCSGITKLNYDVRRTIYVNGRRVIAVDPSVIALGSIVRVDLADGQSFEAIAADVGASIKNFRIDVLVASYDEAIRLGRQQATVTILK